MEARITLNVYYDNYSVEANNLNELNKELRWAKRKNLKILRIAAAYYVKENEI